MKAYIAVYFLLHSAAAIAQSDVKLPIKLTSLPALPPLGQIQALPGQGSSRQVAYESDAGSTKISPTRAPIYRHVMRNGSVAYSDKMLANSKLTIRLDESSPTQGISLTSSAQSQPKIVPINDVVDEVKITVNGGVAAQLLDEALRKQREAAVVKATDRSFSNRKSKSGGRQSRLSEAYFKRQVEAEAAVKAAQAVVEQSRR